MNILKSWTMLVCFTTLLLFGVTACTDPTIEETEYSVKFMNEDGEVTEFSVENGKTVRIEDIPTPTKPHYEAVWYMDASKTKVYLSYTPIIKDMRLYLGWERLLYTVQFDVMDGDKLKSPYRIVKSGDPIGSLPEVSRQNHASTGWFMDKSFTKAITASTVVTANMTIYVKWAAGKHNVLLVFNSDTPPLSIIVSDGYSIDAPTIDYKNHVLLGWHKKADFSDKEYIFGSFVTSSFNLYANWEKQYHTVTLDHNGGRGPINSIRVPHGNKITPPQTSRTIEGGRPVSGYIFDSWHTDKASGSPIYNWDSPVTQSFTP